jgi:hypothetical protein
VTFLARMKGLLSPHDVHGPRVAVFGDSHTAALIRAHQHPSPGRNYDHIRIFRLQKEKDGKSVGDADLASFCRHIRTYTEDDFVFSAVGGNQYAVISTVQGSVDYDFLTSPADEDISSDRAALLPLRAIAGYLDQGVRGTIGPVLTRIREASKAKVYHLAPPPPKEDNAFIAANFESRFAREGIAEFGPTRPGLRLKCWKIQFDCLARLCRELDIVLVAPPAKALTDEGYLHPQSYANDVTHANRRYGALVLHQISKITRTGLFDGRPAA